jgi:hypothetical protein
MKEIFFFKGKGGNWEGIGIISENAGFMWLLYITPNAYLSG